MAETGRPRKYTSADEMQNKIDEYFDNLRKEREAGEDVWYNEKTGIPAFFQRPAYYGSLLLYLDLVYQTAQPYEDGDYDDELNSFSEVLTRARMRIEQDLAEGAIRGKFNPKVTESALQRHHRFATKYEVKTDVKQHGSVDISQEIAELLKDKQDDR